MYKFSSSKSFHFSRVEKKKRVKSTAGLLSLPLSSLLRKHNLEKRKKPLSVGSVE